MSFTKWLSYSPATKDTTLSASGRKWESFSTTTPIRELIVQLLIPAFSLAVQRSSNPYIARQYNYTSTEPFTITNWLNLRRILTISDDVNYVVCVRFVKNGVTYRYKLNNANAFGESDFIRYENYEGQIIYQNFVIEIWSPGTIELDPLINTNPITLLTSVLYSPTSYYDTDGYLVVLQQVELADLLIKLPFTLPLTMPSGGPWLSN